MTVSLQEFVGGRRMVLSRTRPHQSTGQTTDRCGFVLNAIQPRCMPEGFDSMKIVLREDVPKVGEAGSVQTVSDGYARNYLIPKGLAVVATTGEMKVAAHNQAVKDRKIARQEDLLRSLSEKIDGQRMTFTAKAGDQGRLYGSITATDVATALGAQISETIDRRRVVLDEPLRSIGEHTVTVHLVGRLRPQVTVIIEADKADEPEEAEAANASEAGASVLEAEGNQPATE